MRYCYRTNKTKKPNPNYVPPASVKRHEAGMVINSNEFVGLVKRHLILNKNFDEWNIKIDKMNDAGLLSPNTYQNLKNIIIDIKKLGGDT